MSHTAVQLSTIVPVHTEFINSYKLLYPQFVDNFSRFRGRFFT